MSSACTKKTKTKVSEQASNACRGLKGLNLIIVSIFLVSFPVDEFCDYGRIMSYFNKIGSYLSRWVAYIPCVTFIVAP